MSAPGVALQDERQSVARYLGAIRHHWGLIAFLTALSVSVALFYAFTTPDRYEAEAELVVAPITESSDILTGIKVLRDEDTAPLIVGRRLNSPQVRNEVARRLDAGLTGDELAKKVDIQPIQQSSVVSVKATDESPELAATIANAFTDVLIDQQSASFNEQVDAQIERLRTELDAVGNRTRSETLALEERLAQLTALKGSGDPTVSVLSPAVVPTQPVWPRPLLAVAVAVFAGLLLGLGAALILELADPRLVNENELLERVSALAWIPRVRTGVVRSYLRGRGSLPTDLWEAYRTLRASLSSHGVGEGPPKAILVTSAIQGEGKTMTSANLAIAMAAGGHRVVLVDGDFRRSMIASVFGVPGDSKGFASLLSGSASADEALVPAVQNEEYLRLVVAGGHRPIDLLEPRRIERVLAELKEDADVVIVDSPPMTEFADAVALADAVDVVLVAVRLGHSRRDRFNELLLFLTRHGITPAGFVVTSMRRSHAGRPARRGQLPLGEWLPDTEPGSRTNVTDSGR